MFTLVFIEGFLQSWDLQNMVGPLKRRLSLRIMHVGLSAALVSAKQVMDNGMSTEIP
jgi:hypothetical protein